MSSPSFEQRESQLKVKLRNLAVELKAIRNTGQAEDVQTNSFKGMMKTIDKLYDRLQDTYDKLVELYIENDMADLPAEAERNVMANGKSFYYEAHTIFINIFQNTASQSQTAPLNVTLDSSAVGQQTKAKCPKISLPKFSGQKLEEWPIFRDTFKSLIYEDTSLRDVDKYHHLVGCLSDGALAVLRSIPLLDNNYQLAWTTLLTAFDHKRTLAKTYLESLLNYKYPSGQSSTEALKYFLSSIPPSIAALQNLKIPKPEEYIFFELAIRCLDTKTREAFELANTATDYPTFDTLVKFVEARQKALLMTETVSKEVKAKSSSHPTTPNRYMPKITDRSSQVTSLVANTQQAVTSSSPPRCKICSSSHRIAECPTYLKASVTDRYELAKKHRCCFNCLHPGQHSSRDCKSTKTCGVCSHRHHTTLHRSNSESKEKSPVEVAAVAKTSSQPSVQVALCKDQETTHILLGTATARILDSTGKYQTVRILIDSGSQRSLMTQACQSRLGLPTTQSHYTVMGIGQSVLDQKLQRVTCTIKPNLNDQPLIKTTALVVAVITSDLPQTSLPNSICKSYSAYELADPYFWKPGPIDLLLGADVYGILVTSSPIVLSSKLPILLNTILGHVVMGKYQVGPDLASTIVVNCLTETEDINTTLKRFWTVEEPAKGKINNPDDDKCEAHFEATHYRTKTGRYVASLPFKYDDTSYLGASKSQALKRLLRLESTLAKNPTAKQSYVDFLDEYLALNHMKRATSPGTYFLPHHAVRKVDDPENKIRVVFDASAKTSTNRSLNECLFSGPKLQMDISEILINFRRHKFVITADIKKMYRQILIHPSDLRFQHILWRPHPDQEIEEYELLTLTYGMSCAPFIALRVIQQLIHDEGQNYPLAADILKSDIYVDDIVSGSDSYENTLELITQLIGLMKKGGFELAKWSSNCSKLLQQASVGSEDSLIDLSNQEDSTIKILGLQWNSTLDAFSYKIRQPPTATTKRMILSTIARLYDPLGFLSPVIFTAKKLLQDVWISGKDWDEEILETSANLWKTFLYELPKLESVAIPRFLTISPKANYQLIGFSDASERGYSAVIYLRVSFNKEINIFLLKAKTKLAPLKPTLSIPRLELCGAGLLATLYSSIESFCKKINLSHVYLFSDSTTVLSWLQTPAYRLKTYVAHRVNAILEATDPSMWHHVRTHDNPADLSSRGVLPAQLVATPLWWRGPPWLAEAPEEWPTNKLTAPLSELPELKPDPVTCIVVKTQWDVETWMERFSSFSRLIRTMAYVYRFIYRSKEKGAITSTEFKNATLSCIRLLQRKFYPKGDSQHDHLFAMLNVFEDDVGLYRVGGRLRHSSLSYEEKHPLLLPRRSHFNNLLIDFFHQTHLHVGNQALRATLQREYWIPSCLNLIKQRTRLCKSCWRSSVKPQPPYMGDLPTSRLQHQSVFHHTGVDFAGPLLCRESDRRKSQTYKVYICIFVCFASKAVHIEVAYRLTTEAFLDCLDRFISRRGMPAKIFSDCGTNFIGSANYLKEVYNWLLADSTKSAVTEFSAPKGIEWQFNPPSSPHFGGLWEAAVKSTKTLLFKTFGNHPFTERELSTICAKIESILNSRLRSEMYKVCN